LILLRCMCALRADPWKQNAGALLPICGRRMATEGNYA